MGTAKGIRTAGLFFPLIGRLVFQSITSEELL